MSASSTTINEPRVRSGGIDARATDVAARERIDLAKFAFILAQLGLLALIIRQFQVESGAFVRIALLAFIGFAIHYFLPSRWRLPFFVGLSVASVLVVFGIANALWLLALGGLLIGICQLPIALKYRIGALIGVGAVYALFATGVIQGPWSSAIWPILGSMFAFRLVSYLYDVQHERTPSTWSQRIGYFFMIPNVCFPFFPVVDYAEFKRTYYNDERHRIYQTGVDWMIRGIIHLIVYRFVYQHLTITPAEVVDPDTLVQFIVTNFLLYLKISGIFHLITGLLHLFGFNLLATHHRYLLASSFTDLWRRINIYWKDFMMKLFYYPIMFRLRHMNQTAALVITTLIVFLSTWLLHSYLWFWLRGDFPLIWQDAVFWGVLALVVAANSVLELRKGRLRSLRDGPLSAKASFYLGLKTTGVFFFVCVLWSLWTSDSFSSWLSMWQFLWNGTLTARDAFPSYLLGVGAVIFVGAIYFGRSSRGNETKPAVGTSGYRFPVATVAMLIGVAAMGVPQIYRNLGPDTATLVVSLRSNNLSRADSEALVRGYYEQLTRVDRFGSELWDIYANKPAFHWLDVKNAGLVRYTGDFLQEEMVPSYESPTPYGMISINRWGMRDKDYAQTPAPGVYRAAMLGASIVMGWGVEADEMFESLVENRLNEDSDTLGYEGFEILNFAVSGYTPLQQRAVLDKVYGFQLDALIYIANPLEQSRAIDHLADVVRKRIAIPYPSLAEFVARAGVSPEDDQAAMARKLAPFRRDVLAWLYREIAEGSRARGIKPVWVFVPEVTPGSWMTEIDTMKELAASAGFVVIDLTDVYAGQAPASLRLAEWDQHPNAIGHQLIADALYRALRDRAQELFVE